MKRRIEVKGTIEVGHVMRLAQRRRESTRQKAVSHLARPDGRFSDRGEYSPTADDRQLLPYSRLEYELEDTKAMLVLENDGLTASYCIVGATGSGKTMLLVDIASQVLGLHADSDDRKFGAVIFDPKATLIEDVAAIMRHRPGDLDVINTSALTARGEGVNVIDCALDPWELGRSLVLAAQAAGVAASEPFWFLQWSNLFGAALFLLTWFSGQPVTLRRLIDSVLLSEPGLNGEAVRGILVRARLVERDLQSTESAVSEGRARDARQAIGIVRAFYGEKYAETVLAFVQRAYGAFARSAYACYSSEQASARGLYDDVIERGRVVLVSLSPAEPDVAKILCTLIKVLFQQTVVGRKERCRTRSLTNWTRPILMACDEYSEVASEVPGQPSGDGHFFALARENGCMGLFATQSVNVLEQSSLGKAWKAVFSNFAAKIFMSVNDIETVDEASRLAGEDEWQLLTRGSSRSRDGGSSSTNEEIRERKSVPHSILTRLLQQRQGVVIGSLDGRTTPPAIHFIQAREVEDHGGTEA